jgi:hypothetical protein
VRLLAALVGAAVVLLVVELSLGALGFGKPDLADPCTSRPAFAGGGLDGEVQRFALSGLNGAACRLHATREELVLSFVPAAGTKRVRWDRRTIEEALRAGFDQAFDDLEARGLAGLVIGHVLEVVVGAPLDFFLDYQLGFGAVQPRRSSSASRARTCDSAIRSCASESRSRIVTVSSSSVCSSIVNANGVPISSWRR